MRKVFVDTLYWIAVTRPGDQWKESAEKARSALGQVRLVTTDEVLVEFLNSLGNYGDKLRKNVGYMVRAIIDDQNTTVVPQSRESFLNGLRLFLDRSDKEFGLTDCISMATMRKESIKDVLTNDHHFAQEGFNILMPDK